jgi:diguanylate cyclase (GGDEF)-like protein
VFKGGVLDWDAYLEPEDRAERRQALGSASGESHGYVVDYKIRQSCGSLVWVRENGVVYRSGGQIYAEGLITDITELKLSAMSAREVRVLLQAALENSPSGVLIGSVPAGSVRFANRAASEMILGSGSETQILMGCGLLSDNRPWRLYHVDGREVSKEERPFYRSALSSEVVVSEEFLVIGLDRKPRWVGISSAPIFAEDGSVVAVIVVISDITEKKDLELKLERDAYHDILTGLPNRSLLLERLERELRRSARKGFCVGLLFIDLDDFKPINDEFGHAVGDQVLVEVSKRMSGSVRDFDTVARLGGDEFVVLLTELSGEEELRGFAQRLLGVITEPLRIDGRELKVGGSVGASISSAGEILDAAELLRTADWAMYAAKSGGKNAWRVYDPDVDSVGIPIEDRMTDLLRVGLRQRDFLLEYQPQISLRSGEVSSIEALARLRREGDGQLILPKDFSEGLVLDGELAGQFTVHLLERVLEERVGLHESLADVPFTLNLRLATLRDEWFLQRVDDLLRLAGGFRLCFEVQEKDVLSNLDVLIESRAILAEMDVGVIVDHFGLGRWSFQDLRRLQVEQLKVCPSVVAQKDELSPDLPRLAALLGLAESIGVPIAAVGIESGDDGRALASIGFDLGQGFFIARPVGIGGLLEAVESRMQPDSWAVQGRLSARGCEILDFLVLMKASVEQFLLDQANGRVSTRLISRIERLVDRVGQKRFLWSDRELEAFDDLVGAASHFSRMAELAESAMIAGESTNSCSESGEDLLRQLDGVWDSLLPSGG